MCVGLSAKVVKISEGTAVVDAGGAKREVSAQLLEDLEPGDYVMVHAGVAIAKITDEDDDETDQLTWHSQTSATTGGTDLWSGMLGLRNTSRIY